MRRSSFVQGHPFDPRPADTGRGIAEANSAPKNGIFLRGICSSRRTRRRCGIKSGNLRVPRHPSGGLTRSYFVQGLSAAAGRVQVGESFTLPLPPLESGSLRASRHLSGWAYPVLDCAGVECGRNPSANWGRGLRAPSPCPYPQGPPFRRFAPAPLKGSL